MKTVITINKLCSGCTMPCKQGVLTKIISCPKYKKIEQHKQLVLKI